MIQRLDKIISSRTGISRKEAISAIRSGRVLCGGEAVRDNSAKLDPSAVRITVDGRELEREQFIYIMQNKPLGIVSASEGEREKNVIDILPRELYRKNLFPVGRLDKASTGFVLITDDGELAHRILSPKSHVEKEYTVEVDGAITDMIVAEFERGMTLKSGERLKAAKITVTQCSDGSSSANVVLSEGKYHQIRRMFARFGLTVTTLHRIRIGGLCLDGDLELGGSRKLTAQEGQKLQIQG